VNGPHFCHVFGFDDDYCDRGGDGWLVLSVVALLLGAEFESLGSGGWE